MSYRNSPPFIALCRHASVWLVTALTLTGCNSGGTSGSASPTPNSQAILGPLSGALIQVYDPADILKPLSNGIVANSNLNDLHQAGRFTLDLRGIPDDRWLLVTATGGFDLDANDDGILDDQPQLNTGVVHGLARAGQWRSGHAHVTALSEIAWQFTKSVRMDSVAIEQRLNALSQALIDQDLNNDGGIDASDLAQFRPDNRQSLRFEYEELLPDDDAGHTTLIEQIHTGANDAQRLSLLEGRFGMEPWRHPINVAPTAFAGDDRTLSPGSEVVLVGSGSDPEHGAITAAWRQVAGEPVTLQDSNSLRARFTLPLVAAGERLVFEFTTSDNAGLSTSDLVVITAGSLPLNPLKLSQFSTTTTTSTAGQPVTFSWNVSGDASESPRCLLDLRGDGVNTITIEDCLTTSTYTTSYLSSGIYLPRLHLLNQDATIDEKHLTFTVSGAITLNIATPQASGFHDSTVDINLGVTATFEVSSAIAEIDGQQTVLLFNPAAICSRGGCRPGFSGQLKLMDSLPGQRLLHVTVKDVTGQEGHAYRYFTLDSPPTLTLTAPLDDSLANPQTRITASCEDDDIDSSPHIEVLLPPSNSSLVPAGLSQIDQSIDLSAAEGSSRTLTVRCRDSVGQITNMQRRIHIESSDAMSVILTVDGPILDINNNKVLYKVHQDDGDQLWIQDRSSLTRSQIPVAAGKRVTDSRAFLTPIGAIFVAQDAAGTVLSARIYHWRHGALSEGIQPNSTHSLEVTGDYAIWSRGLTLERYQFSTGQTTRISANAGNWKNAITATGQVFWWESGTYDIYHYVNGTVSHLTDDVDSLLWNSYVISDGTFTLYRKHTKCCSAQKYTLMLHHQGLEQALTQERDTDISPGPDYRLDSGWIAYTDIGNLGQKHVWRRSPSGSSVQLTFFGTDSRVDNVGSTGEVLLTQGQRRYRAIESQPLEDIGSTIGKSYWLNEGWLLTIGRHLLELP